MTASLRGVLDSRVKAIFVLPLALALLTASCTTLENRRYLWEETKVEGPYTRMLKTKPWPWPRPAATPDPTASQAAPPEKPWGK